MLPGINPRKMQQMMKQMGIHQVEIHAKEVIIKAEDKTLVISNPSVLKVNMMGQETFQISGEIREEKIFTTPEISEEDIKTVMEQAEVDQQTAKKALEDADGDLAEAIMSLGKRQK